MKRMLIFIRPDTSVFGSQIDSISSDRYPDVQWDIGETGVRMTRERENDVIEEIIPWANVAKLQTIRTKAEAKLASPKK